ncbi:MAG: hypothetical protein DRI61_05635, partial [Chloroflexi bacterium]
LVKNSSRVNMTRVKLAVDSAPSGMPAVLLTNTNESGMFEFHVDVDNVTGIELFGCNDIQLGGGNINNGLFRPAPNTKAITSSFCERLRIYNTNITTNSTGIKIDKCNEVLFQDVGLIMNWTEKEKDEPNEGLYVNESTNSTMEGLIMTWNGTENGTEGNYSSGWQFVYGCCSSDITILNSTINGPILLNGTKNTLIEHSTVSSKNSTAVKANNTNGTIMVDSFFDVYYDVNISGEPPSVLNLSSSLNIEILNNTIFGGHCGILMDNDGGQITVQNNNIGPVVADAVRLELESPRLAQADNDTVLDLIDNCVHNATNGVNITDEDDGVGDICEDEVNINGNEIENCSEAGVKIRANNTNQNKTLFAGINGCEISGCVEGIKISIESLTEGKFPIVDISVIGCSIQGNLYGVEIDAVLIGGILESPSSSPAIEINENDIARNQNGVSIDVTFDFDPPKEKTPPIKVGGSGNNISDNTGYGIKVENAGNVVIGSNLIANNTLDGIYMANCTDFKIMNADIFNNLNNGIRLENCTNGSVYHNNIVDNMVQAFDDMAGANQWDNGYPSGGNYWSDYIGPDAMSGPLQDQAGSDGIGDIPYDLNPLTADRYPYMAPLVIVEHKQDLDAGWNLISVPMHQFNTSLEEVLVSIDGLWDKVMIYDSTAPEPWMSTSPLKPAAFNEITDLDRTMGIWVHTTMACEFTSYGTEVSTTDIQLHAGWNLVGYPTMNSVDANTALSGTSWDGLECYDVAAPYMLRDMLGTEMMETGKAYWVHVPADTLWTVNW